MDSTENTGDKLIRIWQELENNAVQNQNQGRVYKKFGSRESGIRISYTFPEGNREMLIQAGRLGQNIDIEFPDWSGMGFQKVSLPVPSEGTIHIRFYIQDYILSSLDIFTIICADLVDSLDSCNDIADRNITIKAFLQRWSRFFERHGRDGLSKEHQRGLFGEILFLRRAILDGKVLPQYAVRAWRGCERDYHDYDFNGNVVEIKTTMTKEPRRVKISNERQLNDNGSQSLHLYIITLSKADSGGETLPALIENVRMILTDPLARAGFERGLREAGFLDIDSSGYSDSYTPIIQEVFRVHEGFPRIISIPSGTGDLNYSVIISSCKNYEIDLPSFFQELGGIEY